MIVTGLVIVRMKVDRYAPMRLRVSTTPRSFTECLCMARRPKPISRKPQASSNHPPQLSIADEMTERPKAAVQPYTASAVAAPMPDTKPGSIPPRRVRLTHIRPVGPTGTATEKPTISALTNGDM